jgi:glycosyltransferase involved in cell wall biosynthesis
VRIPFRYDSDEHLLEAMRFCAAIDLEAPNGQRVDRLISLQFPGYGIRHSHHVVWLMHQHRRAYELFDETTATAEEFRFRDDIRTYDREALGLAQKRFANSERVAERLQHYLQLDAEPLHHPPPFWEHFRCEDAQPYLFFPSRLETLKRQELMIRAMRFVRSPITLLLAGDGGQGEQLRSLATAEGVDNRVRFLGAISEAEKIAFYARCLAVCYPPFDEDYGYVTLEAMLSKKAVLTCSDSGGPLAFVQHEINGLVASPEPRDLATAIDSLAQQRDRTRRMGETAYRCYQELELSWDRVIDRLLQD